MGKENGLMLVLDTGKPKEALPEFDMMVTTGSSASAFATINLKPSYSVENKARISMDTLASFTDYRDGSYALSALKMMTGTDSFLGLPDESKGCQIEAYNECQTKGYMAEVKKQCACVPWALSTLADQVDIIWKDKRAGPIAQVPRYCTPMDSACYKAVSITDSYSCKVACSGLFADVQFSDDDILEKVVALAAEGRL